MRSGGWRNNNDNLVIASEAPVRLWREAIPTPEALSLRLPRPPMAIGVLAMTIKNMRTLFALVITGGLWLFASPFVLGYLGVARGNAILVGFILTIVGIMGISGVIQSRQ